METRIAEAMKVNDNINKQHFRGKEEFCWMTNDLSDSVTLSMAYLNNVDSDKNSGIIKMAYVFHPLGYDGLIDLKVIEGTRWKCSLHLKAGQ